MANLNHLPFGMELNLDIGLLHPNGLLRHKGPFKYYVSKIVGGWGWPNDYVCLHSGWVGVAKCLRNQKNKKKSKKGAN